MAILSAMLHFPIENRAVMAICVSRKLTRNKGSKTVEAKSTSFNPHLYAPSSKSRHSDKPISYQNLTPSLAGNSDSINRM